MPASWVSPKTSPLGCSSSISAVSGRRPRGPAPAVSTSQTPPAAPTISSNPGCAAPARANPLIGSVFSNLISNAVKYGAEGTGIVVVVEPADDTPRGVGGSTPEPDVVADRERLHAAHSQARRPTQSQRTPGGRARSP